MPENTASFAGFTRSCDKLLTAVEEKAANLPSVAPFFTTMKEVFTEVKEVKARQDSLQAASKAATQELDGLIVKCREAAIRLRASVKADIGPKSEELSHFGVAPLRTGRRRRVKKAKPAPEAAKAPATAPAETPAPAVASEPAGAANA
jgi:hypothetical protein